MLGLGALGKDFSKKKNKKIKSLPSASSLHSAKNDFAERQTADTRQTVTAGDDRYLRPLFAKCLTLDKQGLLPSA
jgi:hypothetical protein